MRTASCAVHAIVAAATQHRPHSTIVLQQELMSKQGAYEKLLSLQLSASKAGLTSHGPE